MHVLNGEASTKLLKGESVKWDTTTPTSTDKALRVKRLTADATADIAGVLLTDCPVGGYAPMVHTGRVHARVASDVTAGSVVIGDFVSSAAGRMKIRGTPGDYPAVGVAITAAAEEPATGSGSYWADVVLAGLNTASIQQVLRGGLLSKGIFGVSQYGSAATFTSSPIYLPVAGSIVALEILTDTTVAGAGADIWTVTCVNLKTNNNLFVAGYPTDAVPLTADTVRSYSGGLIQNVVYTAETLVAFTLTNGGAAATTATTAFRFTVVTDTGISYPQLFGR